MTAPLPPDALTSGAVRAPLVPVPCLGVAPSWYQVLLKCAVPVPAPSLSPLGTGENVT